MSKIPASVLLIGNSGTGKTTSIKTLVEAGLEVFVVSTEPSTMLVLSDTPKEKLHWVYLPPKASSFTDLQKSVKTFQGMPHGDMLKIQGASESARAAFLQLYQTLIQFKCERCGKDCGSMENLNQQQALVLDSLSGICSIAVKAQRGLRPSMRLEEYGYIQGYISDLIIKCSTQLQAFFVCIGHVKRLQHEVTGMIESVVDLPGTKLQPEIPKWFTDTVLAKRTQTGEFVWSTVEPFASDLKGRLGSVGKNLAPTFRPLVEKWRKLA